MTSGNISIASDAGDKFRSAFQIDSLQQAQDAVNNLDGLWSSGAHDFAKRDQFDDAAQAVKRRFESGSYKPGTLAQAPPPAKDAPAGAPAETRHIASATTWRAICVEPDWCKVGDKPIPFDSFATINQEDRASPNVKARGVPVYRLGDTHKGTEANAGAHVVSQTSQGSGYVKVLNEDQHGVKANGIPVARDKTACLVNCNENGIGGAFGRLQTDYKTMFPVKTQDDWKADRQYFEDAKKLADEEGERISRELDKAKAELDKTSWYRRSQWTQRSEIKDRISSLESQLQARGRDSIYYRDQMNHAFEMAFPESAGGPVMSAGPSWTEQREIGRQVEMQRRNEARLNAATQSPFAMAGAAFAEGMGGDAQAMEGMAQAFDGIAQAGSGRLAMQPGPRPRQLASRSVRRRPTSQQDRPAGRSQVAAPPKPDGTYVKQETLAERYARLVKSNKPWKWDEDFPQGENISSRQRAKIKQQAIDEGLIPDVKMKPGTRYPDFENAGLINRVDKLPEGLWKSGDTAQFNWLDARIPGGRPAGFTWHHSEIAGRMELVPFGPHNIINHVGGRSPGHWAHAPR